MEAYVVETMNKGIQDLHQINKRLHSSLRDLNDERNSSSRLKELRSRIDSGVSLALKVAETGKAHLEEALVLLYAEHVDESARDAILSRNADKISVGDEYKKLIMEAVSVRNAVVRDLERRVIQQDKYSRVTGEVADYKTVVDAGLASMRSIDTHGGDHVGDLDLVKVKKVMEERAKVVMKIHASSVELEKVLYDMYVMVKKRVERVQDNEIEDFATLVGQKGMSPIHKWINKGSQVLIQKGCDFSALCYRYYPIAIPTVPAVALVLFVWARFIPKSSTSTSS